MATLHFNPRYLPLVRTSKMTLRTSMVKSQTGATASLEKLLLLGLSKPHEDWPARLEQATDWLARHLCRLHQLDWIDDIDALRTQARKCISYYMQLGVGGEQLATPRWWGDAPKLLQAYRGNVTVHTATELSLLVPTAHAAASALIKAAPAVLGRMEHQQLEQELHTLLQPHIASSSDMDRVCSGLLSSVRGYARAADYAEHNQYPDLVSAVRNLTRRDIPADLCAQMQRHFVRSANSADVAAETSWLQEAYRVARNEMGRYIYQIGVPGSSAVPVTVQMHAVHLVDQICCRRDPAPVQQPSHPQDVLVPQQHIRDYLLRNWPKARIKKRTRNLQRQHPSTLQQQAAWLVRECLRFGQELSKHSALAVIQREHDFLIDVSRKRA